ncbi:Class I SAM-dependent methyltransferase OS=Streptomyces alboniger OX=132473 GN=CP975_09545 PE=4 SV=1 [Streptomyces alboniger]
MHGVRVFTGTLRDGEPLPEAWDYEALLTAEERAGRTDPYRRVAALLHLCGVRD